MGVLIGSFGRDAQGHYPPEAYVVTFGLSAVVTVVAILFYVPLARPIRGLSRDHHVVTAWSSAQSGEELMDAQMTERLLIGGEWVESRGDTYELRNQYDGSLLARVPLATPAEVEAALASTAAAFSVVSALPAHRRAGLLYATADLISRDREPLGRSIAAEVGKALKFALGEVDRAVQTFRFAAEEAKRIHGETVPMDAAVGAERRLGFWLRVPRGPVAAISPFNFPLNLVAHKVAPALAAGNSVLLKPASSTPLTALHLGRLLMEAGWPAGAFNIITGGGATVGDALTADPRIAVVSFTGSAPVGRGILARAGLKRVILELGSNSAVVVAADADLRKVFPDLVPAVSPTRGRSACRCSGSTCTGRAGTSSWPSSWPTPRRCVWATPRSHHRRGPHDQRGRGRARRGLDRRGRGRRSHAAGGRRAAAEPC